MILLIGQNTMNLLQAAAWLATTVGIILAGIKLWSELQQGRLQRERDLRWRQAEAGKSLNDEMQEDQRAWSAMQMLDSPKRQFVLPNNQTVLITHDHVASALVGDCNTDDQRVLYIRDCFDTYFYFMAMFEHYISSTLVLEEDVAYPMEYYVPLMAKFHPQISAYLKQYNLWRTQKFLERYPAWQNTTTGPTTPHRLACCLM